MKSPIVTIRGGKLPAIEDSEPWDGKDGVVRLMFVCNFVWLYMIQDEMV